MKKHYKKIMISGLLVIILGLFFVLNIPKKIKIEDLYQTNDIPTLITNEQGDLDTGVIGFDKITENDFLSLYFDEDTTHFAVKDKRNDYTWYSSTKKFDELIKTNSIKDLQRSTLQITYLQKDGTLNTMNNYEYSISYKRDFDDSFDYQYTDKGVNITYTLRDRDPKGYWFPSYISKERFDELVYAPVLATGKQLDIRNLEDYYKPTEEDPNIYVITQLTLNEETNTFNMDELSGAQVETLFKLFYEVGYYGNKTDESGNFIEEYELDDVEFDNQAANIEMSISLPEFVIPMEVTLNEDNLDVKINYYNIIEKNGYEIVSIRVLPYFGAVRNDQDGYIVIPEGSGGLINFNNGKTASKSYSSFIYGEDNMEIEEEYTAEDVGAKLPIFGLKTEENSMLAIITSGIAHSKVTADVSEKYDSYNKAYNEFTFKQAGSYKLAENKIQLWMEDDYTYSPQLKYYFFDAEEANYASMATLYGQYLQAKYNLEKLDKKDNSLHLDILGSYDYDSFFLWFPTNINESLTTFEETRLIVDELKENGINNQVIRYQGWFNNGLEHTSPNNIDIDNSLGSKKDFRELNEYLLSQNIDAFYDVDFTKSYNSSSVFSTRNYARVIGGNVSKFYPYDFASLQPNKLLDPYYYNNLPTIDTLTTSFIKDANRLDIPGISLRNLGDTIYSDYRINETIPREFIEYYYFDIFAKFSDTTLMTENANEYAISQSNYITDLETRTSQLVVVDEAIPFYQIAISPYINYAMGSYNFGDIYETDTYLLKVLETGSNIKATLSYKDTTLLKETDFNQYYSVYYENNKQTIIDLMKEYKNLNIQDAFLKDHTILEPGVVKVTYSNNVTYVINYNDESFTYQGHIIEGQSYNEIEVN